MENLNQLEFKLLEDQISKAGLRVIPITPDGNCLFRAVSYGIYRDQNRHMEIRELALREIKENQNLLEFIQGNKEKYFSVMEKQGAWGSHLEMQAISKVFQTSIYVHSLNSQPMKIQWESESILHLSQHLGEHFNFVEAENYDELCRYWQDKQETWGFIIEYARSLTGLDLSQEIYRKFSDPPNLFQVGIWLENLELFD